MAENFGKQLFLKARDDHERASRWTFAVVAALAVFHALVFAPYVGVRAKIENAKKEQAQLLEVSDAVARLGEDLADFKATADKVSTDDLTGLLRNLRSDFTILSAQVQRVRRGEAPVEPSRNFEQAPLNAVQRPLNVAASTPNAPALPNAPAIPPNLEAAPNTGWNMAGQYPLDASASWPRPRPILLPDELLPRLRGASDSKIGEILRSVVDEQIIAPRFGQINELWTGARLASLEKVVASITEDLTRLKRIKPAEQEKWTSIGATVGNALAAVRVIRFRPPDGDPNWWYTVEGKGDVVGSLRADVEAYVNPVTQGVGQIAVAARDEVAKAILDHEEAQKALDAKLTALDESLKAQADLFGGVGKGIKLAAAHLDSVVGWWPLVLGSALGIVLVLRANHQRELIWTARLVAAREDDLLPTRWLEGMGGALRAFGESAGDPDRESPRQSARAFLTCAFGCGWVLFAAYQLLAWREHSTPLKVGEIAAAGCAAVIGGVILSRLRVRSAIVSPIELGGPRRGESVTAISQPGGDIEGKPADTRVESSHR